MVAAFFTAGHHARQLQSAQAQQTAMRERRAERDWGQVHLISWSVCELFPRENAKRKRIIAKKRDK
jgi:hypothetical protein